MIIKSMSRKERTFAQLVGYIERDREDSPEDLYHNFFEHSRSEVIAEFEANARHLKARKNGNVMYHEVVSIARHPDLDVTTQKAMLRDLTERYVAERAPECLVFGTLHDDQAHSLHYHLVISANAIGDKKRHSLKKREFVRIQREIERYCNERYPELEQGRVIDPRVRGSEGEREPALEGKVSEKGYQRYRRTGALPTREALIARIEPVLASDSLGEASALLAANELEFYTHGNQVGVIDKRTGRRHRLNTLGLTDQFERFDAAVSRQDIEPAREQPIGNKTPAGEKENEPAEPILSEPIESPMERPERLPEPQPVIPAFTPQEQPARPSLADWRRRKRDPEYEDER